jgi:hypothetical protein
LREGVIAHLKQSHELLCRGVDVEASAESLHFIKVQLLVTQLIRRLPVLFLPDCKPDIFIPGSHHEFLAYCVKFPQRDVPHSEDVVSGSNQMKSFVVAIENVDDRNPSIFIILSELKLLAIVAGIR